MIIRTVALSLRSVLRNLHLITACLIFNLLQKTNINLTINLLNPINTQKIFLKLETFSHIFKLKIFAAFVQLTLFFDLFSDDKDKRKNTEGGAHYAFSECYSTIIKNISDVFISSFTFQPKKIPK